MWDQTVCNIGPILAFRFIFGVGQIPTKSPKMLLCSKLFALFITFSAISFVEVFAPAYTGFIKFCTHFEYIMYAIISFQTEDKYIYRYFSYLHGIDNLPGANRNFKNLTILWHSANLGFLFFRVIHVVHFCSIYPQILEGVGLIALLSTTFTFYAAELSRLTFVYVFYLLYYRVKTLRKFLEADFAFSKNRISIGNYIQKYLLIVDSLKDIDYPLKTMIALYFFTGLHTLTFSLYRTISILKTDTENTSERLMQVVILLQIILPLILGSVALDLVTDNINDIKVILVEKKLIAKNERERTEVDHMIRLLKTRPLTYTVYRIGPLSLSMTLGIMSFVLITAMAIYQIRDDFN